MTRSRAIVFDGAYQVKIGELEIPEPGTGELLIKTLYTGVSTGTESRVLSGKQTGATFPLIPGYENIGEIVESGAQTSHKAGDIVFHTGSSFTGAYLKCWGAHQEYALVKEVEVYPVPAGLEPEIGVYAKVGAIALRGVKRAHITAKDTVAVVGLGLIGHLAAQCARAFGARVIGVDTDSERLRLAAAAGIDFTVNARTEDVKQKVKAYSDDNVSVALDVTGRADTIKSTAQLLRPMPWSSPYLPAPKLVILGSYTDPIELDYDPLFMAEVDILFSRDTRADDIKDMLNLLKEHRVNPSVLKATCYAASDAPQSYKELVEKKQMRMIFKWE